MADDRRTCRAICAVVAAVVVAIVVLAGCGTDDPTVPVPPTTSTTITGILRPEPPDPTAPRTWTVAASRSYRRPPTPTTTTTAAPIVDPWALPPLLRRIGGCESSGRPDGPLIWTAVNREGSSASGAFQILDSTFRSWQHVYGDKARWGIHRAMDAPPEYQVSIAKAAFNVQGSRPWNASRRCWT